MYQIDMIKYINEIHGARGHRRKHRSREQAANLITAGVDRLRIGMRIRTHLFDSGGYGC